MEKAITVQSKEEILFAVVVLLIYLPSFFSRRQQSDFLRASNQATTCYPVPRGSKGHNHNEMGQ